MLAKGQQVLENVPGGPGGSLSKEASVTDPLGTRRSALLSRFSGGGSGMGGGLGGLSSGAAAALGRLGFPTPPAAPPAPPSMPPPPSIAAWTPAGATSETRGSPFVAAAAAAATGGGGGSQRGSRGSRPTSAASVQRTSNRGPGTAAATGAGPAAGPGGAAAGAPAGMPAWGVASNDKIEAFQVFMLYADEERQGLTYPKFCALLNHLQVRCPYRHIYTYTHVPTCALHTPAQMHALRQYMCGAEKALSLP